jgi:hypothetical protein
MKPSTKHYQTISTIGTTFVKGSDIFHAKKKAKERNTPSKVLVPAGMIPDENSFVIDEADDCSFEG